MSKSRPRKPARRRAPPVPQRRPTISVCVIARNEEEFIGDCLASAQQFVDEMVVLDTGSTDATCEIARAHGARVETFEWCDDFAAARNAAIDQATGDWILMLDADERLQPASGPTLRAFVASSPTGALFYALRIENRNGSGQEDFDISTANRLFPRMDDLRYVGAVHEDLAYPPDPAHAYGQRLNDIRITHLGYLPDVVGARAKFARNRRLLLHETSTRPGDPLPWYYLGMDELRMNCPAEAAVYLRRSLACSDNRPTWSNVAVYTALVATYIELNDVEELKRVVEAAERAGALSAGTRTTLAHGLIERGSYAEAERQLLAALLPNQPADNVRHPGVGGWITRMYLARTYERMGNPTAALRQVELGLTDPELDDPGDIPGAGVRLALEIGDRASLARCMEALAPPGENDLDGHLRLLELRSIAGSPSQKIGVFGSLDLAIGQGDWEGACTLSRTLSGRTTAEAARLLFVANRLHSGGAHQSALNLLLHLYDAQPTLPQLHSLLIPVLTKLGRYNDALAATDILKGLLAQDRLVSKSPVAVA